MKHLTKLFLLAIFVIFASCQDETLTETENSSSSLAETEEALEAEIIVSDGEEDASLVLNEESETRALTFSMSSNLGTACVPDIAGFELNLPDVVSIQTTAKPGDDAYFKLDVLNTNLAGTNLSAWCVDVDLGLGVEGPLDFEVYSSYETLPAGKFENPDNFDLVNYILNQDYVGKASPSGGNYTFGHVQWAIWELIDDENCQSCTFLTITNGAWGNDPNNVVKGQEIVDAALANGEGFIPACGEKIAVVLIPGDNKQSIIITKEVQPTEEECSDCEGAVTKLELEFDWCRDKRVKIYQKRENSCYGTKIFDKVLTKGEKFTIDGANSNGTFGKYIYIYINHCYYTKIKTNCYLNIGPGYTKGIFNVISGESSHGGELCEYVKPDYKCYRHWSCKYYSSCRYYYYGY